METNRTFLQSTVATDANDIQNLIAMLIALMLFVAISGPMPYIQTGLWLVLCSLFGLLGHVLIGDVLWR
jgi:hypothetical protein